MGKIHRKFLYGMISLFYLIGRTKYRVRINGLGAPPENTGIITTNNHQRDDDVILLAPAFFYKWRKWKNVESFGFIGRGDLFMPCYFPKFYPDIWSPLKRILFHVSFGPLLRYYNSYPMHILGTRNLHELLFCIMNAVGDKPLGEVLAVGWKEKYPLLDELNKKAGGKLQVSGCIRYSALDDLRKCASFDDLSKEYYVPVKNNCVKSIKNSLKDLTVHLDKGNALYFPVEGGLTHDGSLKKNFRAGFGRIVEDCENVSLVPLNITYDFMQKRRCSVFLNFGKATKIRTGTARSELIQNVTDQILSLQTAAMSSLLSLAITKIVNINKKIETSLKELTDMTKQALDIYKKHGHFIDKRLESTRFFIRRLKKAIKWGREKGLWNCIREHGDISLKIDMQVFCTAKPGPWPNINYYSYIMNQLPDYIAGEYMGDCET
jgi:hypothetical protein